MKDAMRLSAPVAQKDPGKCEKAVRNSLSENGVSDEQRRVGTHADTWLT